MNRIEELADRLKACNEAYRRGAPLIVSDNEYDSLVEQLRALDPGHPFLNHVEPEVFTNKEQVRHPFPMLSIEKAYTTDELEKFLNRAKKEADALGIHEPEFKVTPKLDGLAGRDDGTIFATRGNGEVGFEISSAFKKGVVPKGGRGLGIGEIVILQSYFDEHLSDRFEHPRNMVAGIVSADNLNEYALKALEDEAVHFVPYEKLPSWKGKAREILYHLKTITRELSEKTDYPIDGMVVSIIDEKLREHMGATAHHYRWQIAVKTKGDTAVARVEGLVWQVGRMGNVTPVLEISPVSLSGATIRRVTAHNAGMVERMKLGPGAEIEIIRSGEVIPKLEKVLSPAREVTIPGECPSCGSILEKENDFIKCVNYGCHDQIVQGVCHFFKVLGTADWFGIKSVEKLVSNGFDTLEKIYSMKEDDFRESGFGPVQSVNLFNAVQTSKTSPVEDWRFLAAFGIPDLGTGDSRKILAWFRIEAVPELTPEEIIGIHGFGDITSKSVANGIAGIRQTMRHMLSLGFNLVRTPLESEKEGSAGGPITGKGIVFTGKMSTGSREEMQARARSLGARVQSAVSGKTDYLVIGEKVGRAKIEKAGKLGITIVSEKDYMDMIT